MVGSFLIPFSLLTNALIGLVGYVELAWAIAHYQGLFLVALTALSITKRSFRRINSLGLRTMYSPFQKWLVMESIFIKTFSSNFKISIIIFINIGLI